eukprot:3111733-Pleurochrysis_carterae.AAC.1
MQRPSFVKTALRPRRSAVFETKNRVTIIEELLKARSRASSWCCAMDMFRPRSCLSSSTNSGARVAALTAASLMR